MSLRTMSRFLPDITDEHFQSVNDRVGLSHARGIKIKMQIIIFGGIVGRRQTMAISYLISCALFLPSHLNVLGNGILLINNLSDV